MESPPYRVSPRQECVPLPPGDSISAKCEMDSQGGKDIFLPLVEKVAPLIKMSRIEEKIEFNDFF